MTSQGRALVTDETRLVHHAHLGSCGAAGVMLQMLMQSPLQQHERDHRSDSFSMARLCR